MVSVVKTDAVLSRALRQDHGGSLFAGWPQSADGAFPMPAGLEQFPRVWKE